MQQIIPIRPIRRTFTDSFILSLRNTPTNSHNINHTRPINIANISEHNAIQPRDISNDYVEYTFPIEDKCDSKIDITEYLNTIRKLQYSHDKTLKELQEEKKTSSNLELLRSQMTNQIRELVQKISSLTDALSREQTRSLNPLVVSDNTKNYIKDNHNTINEEKYKALQYQKFKRNDSKNHTITLQHLLHNSYIKIQQLQTQNNFFKQDKQNINSYTNFKYNDFKKDKLEIIQNEKDNIFQNNLCDEKIKLTNDINNNSTTDISHQHSSIQVDNNTDIIPQVENNTDIMPTPQNITVQKMRVRR